MSAPAVAPQVTSDFGLLSDDDEKTIETSLPPSPRSPATPQRGLTRELKRYNVMGIRFDVDVRYDVLDVVGQGAYGVVCAAHDSIAGEAVAIKKIANAFEHATYTKRTLREIRLLRLLRHDNIVRLKTLLPPVKSDGFRDLYIISDLLETDLSSVIKSPQPLSDEHVQFFIYQVLRGVKFLHTCSPPVTHRDLKPRNLLVNSNCDLKTCDFGLARVDVQSSSAAAMTDYVATRVEIKFYGAFVIASSSTPSTRRLLDGVVPDTLVDSTQASISRATSTSGYLVAGSKCSSEIKARICSGSRAS